MISPPADDALRNACMGTLDRFYRDSCYGLIPPVKITSVVNVVVGEVGRLPSMLPNS